MSASPSRRAALGGLRMLALTVGVLAAAAGLAYAIPTIAGPKVLWVLDGGPPGLSGLVDLRPELRIAHALAVLLGAATVSVIAFLLAGLAGRVRSEVQFVPAVSRTVWGLAITLAVGSWLAQIAESLAVRSGTIYPDTGDPASIDPASLPLSWELGAAAFLPDPPFLGLALAFALLAGILRAGERLQRDTEGLV